jgi:hypothetical protein
MCYDNRIAKFFFDDHRRQQQNPDEIRVLLLLERPSSPAGGPYLPEIHTPGMDFGGRGRGKYFTYEQVFHVKPRLPDPARGISSGRRGPEG